MKKEIILFLFFIFSLQILSKKGRGKLRRDKDDVNKNWPDFWNPPDFPTPKQDINLKCDENCKIAYDRCDALYKIEFMEFCQTCCMPSPNTRCEMTEMDQGRCKPAKFNSMMELPENIPGGIKGYILYQQRERDRLYDEGKWVRQKPARSFK